MTPRSILMNDDTWARVKTAGALAGKSAGTWAREVIERELVRELGERAAMPVTDAYLEQLRAEYDAARQAALEAQINGKGGKAIDAARAAAGAAARRLAIAQRALR